MNTELKEGNQNHSTQYGNYITHFIGSLIVSSSHDHMVCKPVQEFVSTQNGKRLDIKIRLTLN